MTRANKFDTEDINVPSYFCVYHIRGIGDGLGGRKLLLTLAVSKGYLDANSRG